jgi:uncharacterized RDD family membrane protein YckC
VTSELPSTAVLASPLARLGGRLVDGFLLLVVTAPALRGGWGWAAAVLVVTGAYEVVATAVWGRTVGKVVARTRVVDADTDALPSWRASIQRWLVPSAPDLLALVLWSTVVGAAIGSVGVVGWAVACYVGILRPPWHQGLHDRVAGTVVVSTRAVASPSGGLG